MIVDCIKKLIEKQDLTRQEAIESMTEIMDGIATPAQISSFLTALRMKGETIEEITGFVNVMRDKSIKVNPKSDDFIDTCGTGGDKLNTFNISTTSTFVVVGAGVKVAKHGNRSASSKCGSADVLESLGANLNLSPESIAKCIDDVGLGFMFAPNMHPAMKNAVGPRREIGIRTIFNLLGPMTNPAGAKRQIVGVFAAEYTEVVAEVLFNLGTQRAMVVHGLDGLDEISTLGETKITELDDAKISTYYIYPKDFGIQTASVENLLAGDGSIEENKSALISILEGEKGARRDITILNAAAAIYVAGNADSIEEGIEKAKISIDDGCAIKAMNDFVKVTQELG
ncbi:MAG: anthranilate phosphoribosyltransferase [Armatimonadota bacterium]